ncbi:MAG: prepilin-type N-terminal cleavage/methylation domain-containing protein [Kiritimatiellae bacterium]|nr:prepilin-type N-terminal cleavage/methylation domain-containing protein [Kiritimatiellia bacterium]
MKRCGFTMIELLIAIALTATIVTASIVAFSTASRIWRNGADAADAIHHGDYVMEQLASALRSAYYPDATQPSSQHGMVLVNDGNEDEAHDSLSWVKFGSALVGRNSGIADSPHRIVVYTVEEGEEDDEALAEGGLVVKAWRLSAQIEDFDPEDEEYVKPRLLMPDVLALDFKVLDPEGNLAEGKDPVPDQDDFDEQGGFEWIDEDWKDDYTNRLPYAVVATLYLKPSEKGAEPIALRRLITLPTAPLSWRDKGAAGGDTETSGNESANGKNKNKNEDANGNKNKNGNRNNGNNGNGNGNNNGNRNNNPSERMRKDDTRSAKQTGET